jgi:hypothetical protein
MSQYFDTFFKDLVATPYVNPNTLPPQPDVQEMYKNQVNMTGDVVAYGPSNNLVSHITPSGVVPGIYKRVRVNIKGQVVEGLPDIDDNATISWTKIVDTPTTRDGYGITDVYTKGEVDIVVTDAIEAAQQHQTIVMKTYYFPKSTVWRVKHNLFTLAFTHSILNDDGTPVYANINLVDSTEFLVEFTSAEGGSLHVVYNLSGNA